MNLDSGQLVDADVPAELRQERIAGLVAERGFQRVVDLAGRFQVSTVTIRSDLQALEARGRLHRIRGGAVPAGAVDEGLGADVLGDELGVLAQAVAGALDLDDPGVMQEPVETTRWPTTGSPKISPHLAKPRLEVRIMAPRS